jgi:hypothetical protein
MLNTITSSLCVCVCVFVFLHCIGSNVLIQQHFQMYKNACVVLCLCRPSISDYGVLPVSSLILCWHNFVLFVEVSLDSNPCYDASIIMQPHCARIFIHLFFLLKVSVG